MTLSSGQSSSSRSVYFYQCHRNCKHMTMEASFIQSQDLNFLFPVPGVHIWAALPAFAAGNGVRHKNAGAPCHLLRHRESQHSGEIWRAIPGECTVISPFLQHANQSLVSCTTTHYYWLIRYKLKVENICSAWENFFPSDYLTAHQILVNNQAKGSSCADVISLIIICLFF